MRPPEESRMADVNRGNRPLSPHLTVYRPQVTSVLSILHRITGVGLTLGQMLRLEADGRINVQESSECPSDDAAQPDGFPLQPVETVDLT